METLLQDFRYGMRMLLKKPGFTAVAIIALALGIGASTSIFSVINTVLLKPLPYEDPQQVVMVWQTSKQAAKVLGTARLPATYADFYDWRDQNSLFDSMAALDSWLVNLTGMDEPLKLNGARATPDLFSLLRVKPLIGRTFLPEEENPGAERVVVLSHGLWQQRFGADTGVVGRSITLNDASFTVVGVLPEDFRFTEGSNLPRVFKFAARVDIWTPLVQTEARVKNRGNHNLAVVGRLKAGVTPEQAQAEMQTIARRIAEGYGGKPDESGTEVVSLREQIAGDIRPALLVLMGAVIFVLLIACANVAGLLLVRASARYKELALRTALGASRARLIRQLLTESVMLALVGGGAGALLALWGTDLLISLSPDTISHVAPQGVDLRVLAFTLAVSVATGVVFGLVPALASSKPNISETLKEGGRGATDSRGRARNALVVAEIALALVLLVGAGLLIKSFAQLMRVDPGFNPDRVALMDVALPYARYGENPKRAEFFRQAVERIRSLPGVESVGINYSAPLSGADASNVFAIEGQPPLADGEWQSANLGTISPDYFRTLEIPLVRGREFTDQDSLDSQPVAIVDETMVRRYFGGDDPVGKRVRVGGRDWLTVVGVVGSVKSESLEGESRPYIYVPYAQRPSFWPSTTIAMRSRTNDTTGLIAAAKREINAIDKDQPVSNITTLAELYRKAAAPKRFSMALLSLFAGVALVLAGVGLYGVMAYSVSQRTHEIGIRMALGAQKSHVFNLVVRQAVSVALVGVSAGLVAALLLTRLMSSLLFGVSATDPVVYGAISLLLVAVVLLASYIPARRAMKVDPMTALRYE
ncbi:MAG TPA: ABC transporter permease [Blastocatellia bacterium]|nr:ABC transporter permease [Blastocatellia bacterium]